MGDNHLKRLILSTLLALHFDYSAGQCLGSTLTLTATTALQSISSPNYPYSYYNNYYCEWSITSSLDKVVFYVFTDNIERGYDLMEILSNTNTFYNSDEDYYHSLVDVDVSTGSTLRLTFDTDYSITYGGFLIYYIASLDNCGQVLTATGTAQQLTYIYNYAENECDYIINSGNRVKITIQMVRNVVLIIDGGTSNNYNTVGSVYISTLTSLIIRGTSGNDFVITYEQASSGLSNLIPTEAPVPTTECIGSGYDILVTDTVQILKSESYPGAYPNNRFCNVRITAQVAQESIRLEINDFNVVGGDYLRIYDGQSAMFNQYANLETYASYTSTGHRVYIEFTTNEYGVGRGFNISFYSVPRVDPLLGVSYIPEDTYTASSSLQSIYSPNYPSNYDNLLDVYWLIIKSDQNDNIRLEFHRIAVEDSTSCVYDKVTFYDGNLVSDPVLLEICGYDPTHIEDNTGLYILVHFQTDYSVTKQGFRIDFYTGPAPSSDEEDDEGMPSWVVPVIVVGVVFVAISTTVCIYIDRESKAMKARIGAGKVDPPKQEKRTTQQLLTEITTKYGAKLNEPKKKVYRKRLADNRPPEPKTTGTTVNVVVISHPPSNPQPQPEPNLPPIQPRNLQPFGINEPAYPPLYIGSGGNVPPSNITPVYTNIPQSMPTAPVDDPAYPAVVPSPFAYFTPSEARNQGTHQ